MAAAVLERPKGADRDIAETPPIRLHWGFPSSNVCRAEGCPRGQPGRGFTSARRRRAHERYAHPELTILHAAPSARHGGRPVDGDGDRPKPAGGHP